MQLNLFVAGALTGLALAIAPASAHEPTRGPNGGLQVDAGDYHAELVVDGSTSVAVHLADAAGKPVPTDGFKANAIFIIDGKPQRFTLQPAGAFKLAGTAPVGVSAQAKGAVQITTPDGKSAQAKF